MQQLVLTSVVSLDPPQSLVLLMSCASLRTYNSRRIFLLEPRPGSFILHAVFVCASDANACGLWYVLYDGSE